MDSTWIEKELNWTEWINLYESWKNPIIPKTKGLYRIKRKGSDELYYIGQTSSDSMNLRKRLSMLKGIYANEMPYRDPHTAAPALWALKDKYNCEFEVSVTTINGTKQWIKGMEALALSIYRIKKRKSPNYNFGRMPEGYKMSSANNSKLTNAGKRFRGGKCDEKLDSHISGVETNSKELDSNIISLSWCNFKWSNWIDFNELFYSLNENDLGLYRIRKKDSDLLLYIGEGKIKDRIKAHVLKENIIDNLQGQIFSPKEDLLFSYVTLKPESKHHLLEYENDLIASHIFSTKEVPLAQFIG